MNKKLYIAYDERAEIMSTDDCIVLESFDSFINAYKGMEQYPKGVLFSYDIVGKQLVNETKVEMKEKEYKVSECVSFRRSKDTYGCFSNMAGGFPLVVNGTRIRTSEALYQSCRYPHIPELQREIIAENNPIKAKRITRRGDNLGKTRPDWFDVNLDIMFWCLEVKLIQNPSFEAMLLSTSKPIVEYSKKDPYWGAYRVGDLYVGHNKLGLLLMKLRSVVRDGLTDIYPLPIENFLLFGEKIEVISR